MVMSAVIIKTWLPDIFSLQINKAKQGFAPKNDAIVFIPIISAFLLYRFFGSRDKI